MKPTDRAWLVGFYVGGLTGVTIGVLLTRWWLS